MTSILQYNKKCIMAIIVGLTIVLQGCGRVPEYGSIIPTEDMASRVQCGASNCAGCCLNSVCQPGTSIAGCGSSGQMCRSCDSSYQICLPQQYCGLDLDATWSVQVLKADIQSNQNWGIEKKPDPDPYVIINGTRSSTIADTLSPIWTDANSRTSARVLLSTGISVEMWDEDAPPVEPDDNIAPKLSVVFSESDLRKGSAVVVGWGKTLRVYFSLSR